MARERALQQAKLAKTTKAVKEEEESVFKSEIDEAGPFSYGAKPPRKVLIDSDKQTINWINLPLDRLSAVPKK